MSRFVAVFLLCVFALAAGANPPVASYVFPAGGQRGKAVDVKVGGLFLYNSCGFELSGSGVQAPRRLKRTDTRWFEGPMLPLPESQQAEDCPRDMAGQIKIAPDAPLGIRSGRVWTAEGVAPGLRFMVGDLPEVVEAETDGDALPVEVKLPVTVNGRIFPRQDVDIWAVRLKKGETVSCEVHAARLGSPLDSRLEVRDPDGRVIAENDDAFGADSFVRFAAAGDGVYYVRVSDAGNKGGPAYVYRLTLVAGPYLDRTFPLGGRRGEKVRLFLSGHGLPTDLVELAIPADAPRDFTYRYSAGGKLTNPVLLDVDELPEFVEAGANDKPIPLPAVANGRVEKPGEVDSWRFAAKKGESLVFELRASQLGSPLQGVLSVTDEAGKELGRAEGAAPTGDPTLKFTAPADGTYCVRVADKFRTRGGPEFAYRLRMTPPEAPGFRLRLPADSLTLLRGGSVKLKVTAERLGGFNDAIPLTVEGLPAGVKAAPATIPANQAAVDLTLTAHASAAIAPATLTVKGTATVAGKPLTQAADGVFLAVALPVPFKIVGDYDLRLAPRGTVFRKHYKIERNGYDGPITVTLADRQARHLQGVEGPVVTVPAGVNEFDYPVTLPPWMEIGRTSRSCVQGVAVIKDGGQEHEVGYSSVNQNEQVVAVVESGLLGLEVNKPSLVATPGGTAELSLRVSRSKGLTGPVKVELVLPEHVHGVTAEPLTIPADGTTGTLVVRFASGKVGPFNAPAVIRATLTDKSGPVTAEAKVELVPGE